MKERPIICSSESVRAILADRKTQTRRVIPMRYLERSTMLYANCTVGLPDKYGVPGDRLWVKESWKKLPDNRVGYAASMDETCQVGNFILISNFKSPIFMPRWASRITLEIVNIRVERVQEISEDDAKSEGITGYTSNLGSRRSNPTMIYPAFPEKDGGFLTAKQAYGALWDSLNAKRGYPWSSNPWVWVIEFKRLEARNA